MSFLCLDSGMVRVIICMQHAVINVLIKVLGTHATISRIDYRDAGFIGLPLNGTAAVNAGALKNDFVMCISVAHIDLVRHRVDGHIKI